MWVVLLTGKGVFDKKKTIQKWYIVRYCEYLNKIDYLQGFHKDTQLLPYKSKNLPILTHPLSVKSKLETLRSLCTIKFECRYFKPFKTCSMRHFTWDSVNGDDILSNSEAKSCSQYSIDRNMLENIINCIEYIIWITHKYFKNIFIIFINCKQLNM